MAHEAEKRRTAENIWLHYFNDELHKRNIISTLERTKMALKIDSQKPPAIDKQRKESKHSR